MAKRADELLYDSQATLRLVDSQLEELCGAPEGAPVQKMEMLQVPPTAPAAAEPEDAATGDEPEAASGVPAIVVLPEILQRASLEIVSLLRSLRESRVALEQATTTRIQQTHEKLREVTSATEVAATDILDALDRAQTLVDDLEKDEAAPEPGRANTIRQTLRDEIFAMMGALQFQDITTQQLNHAASTLADLESRLADIVRMFDQQTLGIGTAGAAPAPAAEPTADTFAPDASIHNADTRQALADALVAGKTK